MVKESKYAKYIVYEPPKPKPGEKPMGRPKRLVEAREKGNYFDATWMYALDNRVAAGSFYTNCVWLWKKHGADPLDIEIAHTHNFDETLGFAGTVPGKPQELGGELDLWLEDEKFTITKSCLIYVPRGMKHLPLTLKRIDYPIFFWTAGNGTDYTRDSGKEEME
jgi:hypothetical protein